MLVIDVAETEVEVTAELVGDSPLLELVVISVVVPVVTAVDDEPVTEVNEELEVAVVKDSFVVVALPGV